MADTAQDGILGREDIDGIQDARFVEHTMATEGAWKGKRVRLRTLQADERDSYEMQSYLSVEKEMPFRMRAELVARCLVDTQGKRLFGDDEIEQLGRKSGTALDELFQACRTLNGMGAGQVEELAKKSERPNDSSSSASSA